MSNGAVVLFSGGQDSTTCLQWAIDRFGEEQVHPLAFEYGQKHEVEIEQGKRICEALAIKEPQYLSIEALAQLGGAALTDTDITVEAEAGPQSGNVFAHTHGLPSTFVPGRNMMFLTLAAAYGAQLGVYNLVTGVCQADAAGYPDCRQQFISDAMFALTSALDEEVQIHAPLLCLTKADTWKMAADMGILDLIITYTHTCYHGDRSVMHEWGAGCGNCPACTERRNGYKVYLAGVAA